MKLYYMHSKKYHNIFKSIINKIEKIEKVNNIIYYIESSNKKRRFY